MNPPEPPIREVSGKLIIMTVVILAIAAAGLAWGVRFSRTKQVLAFWGGETAALIRDRDSKFEICLIGPEPENPSDPQERLQLGGHSYYILRTINITEADGASHARDSLLIDDSFRWEEEVDDTSQPDWHHLLRFTESEGPSATVAIDLASGRLLYVEEGREVLLSPTMLKGWQQFIEKKKGTHLIVSDKQ